LIPIRGQGDFAFGQGKFRRSFSGRGMYRPWQRKRLINDPTRSGPTVGTPCAGGSPGGIFLPFARRDFFRNKSRQLHFTGVIPANRSILAQSAPQEENLFSGCATLRCQFKQKISGLSGRAPQRFPVRRI